MKTCADSYPVYVSKSQKKFLQNEFRSKVLKIKIYYRPFMLSALSFYCSRDTTSNNSLTGVL